jgi:hypothetical protein
MWEEGILVSEMMMMMLCKPCIVLFFYATNFVSKSLAQTNTFTVKMSGTGIGMYPLSRPAGETGQSTAASFLFVVAFCSPIFKRSHSHSSRPSHPFFFLIPRFAGMMDPAYFVGRKAILDWLNNTFQMNLAKIEETASGAFAFERQIELLFLPLVQNVANFCDQIVTNFCF